MAKKHVKEVGKFQSDAFSNHMNTLLANIRFASLDSPVKTIVVTSSVMDEGKSTCASNLACAMASSGKRTLIVDADLRRRSLGSMLGIHNEHGIYSVLAGSASLRDAVVATPIPNLYFMDCETNVANPADVFATKRFAVLLEKLKESFDYVLFDMPPIGLFVDAAVVSNLADGTILVVRQNMTKRDMVEKAIQQLKAAEAHVLGMVMTFTEESHSDYYYYYYNSEGKRSKRSHHRGPKADLFEETAPTQSPVVLADTNINDWMNDPRYDASQAVAAANSQKQMRTSASAGRMRSSGQNAASAQADPFAPGSFKGGAQSGTSRRARHHRS